MKHPSLPFLLTLALVSTTAAGCATNPLRPDPPLDPHTHHPRQSAHALISAAAAGGATTPLRPDPALDPEMQQLRQRVVDLQREARMNEVEIARLRQQAAELEARGGTSGTRPATRIQTTDPPP